MSDANKDLAARLALLAHETPEFDGDQRILPAGDAFAAILHLIDQTVIPTALEISSENGVLRLEVAGRRLSRLPGVVEDLTADDADALTTAASRIVEFSDNAQTALRVRELSSEAGGADPAQSVSISALAAAAGRPLIDSNAPLIDQFRARLGDAIIAAQTSRNGNVSDTIGDAAAFEDSLADLTTLTTNGSNDTPNLILFEVDTADAPLHGAIRTGADGFAFAAGGVTFAAIWSAFHASLAP